MHRLSRLVTEPKYVARFHAVAALMWLAIGLFGLIQYILYLRHHPTKGAFSPIAASIPILFFISVYANVVGHWSAYQAAAVSVQMVDGDPAVRAVDADEEEDS